MTELSIVLSNANRSGLSARALARAARERGHTLNHDTAARYLRGDHGTPDEATLLAFADVLDVPLRDLRSAADLPAEVTTPYVPPAEASRLSRRQRRAVDEIIRSMLDPSGSRRGAPAGREVPPGRPETPVGSAPGAELGPAERESADEDQRAARHGDAEASSS